MAHHALEFLAGEVIEAAAGDRHHGVARLVAGGEGVDSRLAVHDEDRGDGNAGGQGHLLDHVEQPAFGQVGGLRIHRAAAEHQGDGFAAGGELGNLVEAGHGDHQDRAQADPEEELRLPQTVPATPARHADASGGRPWVGQRARRAACPSSAPPPTASARTR